MSRKLYSKPATPEGVLFEPLFVLSPITPDVLFNSYDIAFVAFIVPCVVLFSVLFATQQMMMRIRNDEVSDVIPLSETEQRCERRFKKKSSFISMLLSGNIISMPSLLGVTKIRIAPLNILN